MVGHVGLAAFIEVPGPPVESIPEVVGGLRHGPAEDLADVLEQVVPVRAVGLVGDQPGVIEGDRPSRRASRTVGSTARPRATVRRVRAEWPAMPVLTRSHARSPEPVRAPTRRSSTVDQQFGFLRVQGGATCGDVPGPVHERVLVGPGELFDELEQSRGTNICT